MLPRWIHNKVPVAVKRRYFELLREGYERRGCRPRCRRVDELRIAVVPGHCGMLVPEPGPISPRFLIWMTASP